MNRISTSLSVAALALAGLALSAEDFQPLMKATQATWPEKRHIGVICNYQANQSQVWALAKAAGEGAHITVVETSPAPRPTSWPTRRPTTWSSCPGTATSAMAPSPRPWP